MRHGSVYSDPGFVTISSTPYSAYRLLQFTDADYNIGYIYMGDTQVGIYIYGQNYDITRSASNYGGTALTQWTADLFGGLPILNNGVDVPQVWLNPTISSPLEDLPNWPSGDRVKVLKTFGNYLVGLNFTISGQVKPFDVRWSQSADPGTVPASWNIADPTIDAGEYPMSSTGGELIDMLPLGNHNIICRKNAVWGMSLVGFPYIFSFNRLPMPFGILSMNCVCEFLNRHFVVTNADIIQHDGNSWQSLVEGKMRTWIFKNLDRDSLQYCFVQRNSAAKEIWFFFRRTVSGAQTGRKVPNTAFIWNWEDNTTSLILDRIQGTSHAIDYLYSTDTNYQSFDDTTGSFDSQTGDLESDDTPKRRRLILLNSEQKELQYADDFVEL